MKPSNEGSQKIDIIVDFLSYKKEKEKEITVVAAGEKDTAFIENMLIPTENSKLLQNGNLETEKGNILVNFADYKQVKENNENRITEFAKEKRKRQKSKDNERVG